MTVEVRTFVIPDSDPEEAQAGLAAFLRAVEIDRIETAYSHGAWRILVLYQDARLKEESAQIKSAIMAALNGWRDKEAARSGLPRDSVLPDSLVAEIAHYAPTTERELGLIEGASEINLSVTGGAIVQVVKKTLEDLID
jgi:ribonuclease D